MNNVKLVVARAKSPVDCVPPPFAPLARPSLWVSYLALNERYLGDVNDDQRFDDEYDVGLELWATCVQNILDVLTRRHAGTTIRVAMSGRTAQILTMRGKPTVDRDEIDGLTTYGNVGILWSSVIDHLEASASLPLLEEVLRDNALPWWMSHGYKEPFLVGNTPNIGLARLVELIRDETENPVEESSELFVPHRIRIHRRFA